MRKRWEHDCRTHPESRDEAAARYRADPDEWVYLCRNAADDVIYVGITSSALGRFRQHSQGAPWFREVVRIDIEHLPSRAAAEARELELIQELGPRHNRAGITAPDMPGRALAP